ncbi:hypothetical protein RKD27_002303 [Streptomyces sp. SAI-126]|nr:hypothetical protein [Streptomyces sp. SAI-119]MDH6495917.1 hypothetical protein [Streptomyces sp. SAI-149]
MVMPGLAVMCGASTEFPASVHAQAQVREPRPPPSAARSPSDIPNSPMTTG